MKDEKAKRGKIRQSWIKPHMDLRGIHFLLLLGQIS